MFYYKYLKKGEEIKEGDEVDISNFKDNYCKWVPALAVGNKAPDPSYPSHRKYRRLISMDEMDITEFSTFVFDILKNEYGKHNLDKFMIIIGSIIKENTMA